MLAGNACSRLTRLIWPVLAGLLCAFVLVAFLRPTPRHGGINSFMRCLFTDMLDGTAHKPFVYRALLPTTVRIIRDTTQDRHKARLTALIESQPLAKKAFTKLNWDTGSAYSYLVACILMYLSFLGFAYYVTRFVILTCDRVQDNLPTRLAVTSAAMLCLPAFFTQTSFLYDPSQLFLFTACLYHLASRQLRLFVIFFVLACFNKETAILLIPLYAITCRKQYSQGHYVGLLVFLVCTYMLVKTSITLTFQHNPGGFVMFHLFDHNVQWLTRGWTFSDIVTVLVIVGLLTYKWNEKPGFPKTAFLCTLPPLVCLACFLGYVEEWRGYYEAYPPALALIVDTLYRLHPFKTEQ